MESTQKAMEAADTMARVGNGSLKRQKLDREYSSTGEKSKTRLVHHRSGKEPLVSKSVPYIPPQPTDVPPTESANIMDLLHLFQRLSPPNAKLGHR